MPFSNTGRYFLANKHTNWAGIIYKLRRTSFKALIKCMSTTRRTSRGIDRKEQKIQTKSTWLPLTLYYKARWPYISSNKISSKKCHFLLTTYNNIHYNTIVNKINK